MNSLKGIVLAAFGLLTSCGDCEIKQGYELGPTIYTRRYDDPEAHQLDLDTLEGTMEMTKSGSGYVFDCKVEPRHHRFEYIISKVEENGDYSFIGTTNGMPSTRIKSYVVEELEGTTIKCNIFLPNWMFVIGRDKWGNEKTKWQSRRAVGTVEGKPFKTEYCAE